MIRYKFPQNFQWGTATSSYQVEGAVENDGRGESIWDTFSKIEGKVFNGDHGAVACDHYHRYLEDCDIMASLGIQTYRFSIAWPRIFPNGNGTINEAGLEFYDRLVDALLERGIQPTATLYHWDLPQSLEDNGGWRSRDTVHAFEEYSRVVVRKLGDRVKRWFTINEPWVAWWLGHSLGIHAPGRKDDEKTLRQVSHHLLLAHGVGTRVIRDELGAQSRVGLVHNMGPVIPFTECEKDIEGSRRAFRKENGWLLQPVFEGCYPEDEWVRLGENTPDLEPEDLAIISTPTDFLGINLYTSNGVAIGEDEVKGFEKWYPRTDFDWPIVPDALYWAIRHTSDLWGVPEILITENGCAFPDEKNGESPYVEDHARVFYLKEHLKSVHRAVQEGLPVTGYFLWSLLDNFEWAEGYSKRFGMVHVDFETQERTKKLSAVWYSKLIENGGF